MSLTFEQTQRTAAELRQAAALTGVDLADLRAASSLSPSRFDAALTVFQAASPADVWAVRDELVAAAEAAGAHPEFSVLTEARRADARRWFGI